jgi:8-oxo-dGTP pyrophosphatase MutT (NUDIX family)
MEAPPIRPAATVILTRQGATGPQVLMGQRGAGAVFMPSKYVFPGGAVDPGDDHPAPLPLSSDCLRRLSTAAAPGALVAAALRELAEETGLALRTDTPTLRFVFRAITPPGRSRRFDACFFLADAAHASGDTESFSGASDELSHLHWIGLAEARALDLPFITEVVLAEVTNLLNGGTQPGVPFFDNSGDVPTFRRID